MKAIISLCVLQLALLAFMAHQLVLIEDRFNHLNDPNTETSIPSVEQGSAMPAEVIGERPVFDEDRLRRLIRSELNAFADSLVDIEGESPPPTDADLEENARRLEAARELLNYYVKVGEISDIEMQQFQLEISRLDPENRRLMLGALVRALNSGELKGRL